MSEKIKRFCEVTTDLQYISGGKGGVLAQLFQKGYPIPDGFIILSTAFNNGKLDDGSIGQIYALIDDVRKKRLHRKFAVRSSALSEDSLNASFAGAFDTILGIERKEDILKAIYSVYNSRERDRVKSYSYMQGIEQQHQMAVVVQLMVESDLSGVLFSANPITSNFDHMIGNYTQGYGDKLVSGEADALNFRIMRPKSIYSGPDEFRKYGSKLYQLAQKIEREFDFPLDIEWSINSGKIYILQVRPITNMSGGNLDTYDMNYTNKCDELWINTNVAEAIPDVYTPFTWSLGQLLDETISFIPGFCIFSGNIYGRPYMNISRRVSVIKTVLGKNSADALKLITDVYGKLPEGLNMPLYPYSRIEVVKTVLPKMMKIAIPLLKAKRKLMTFLEESPNKCYHYRTALDEATTEKELLALWKEELQPLFVDAWLSAAAAALKMTKITTLNNKLTEMVGVEDANVLLSNLRGNEELASLGPMLGIAKIIRGELSREDYLTKYGHRSAHEYEMSIPDSTENSDWLDVQIAEAEQADIEVDRLLMNQQIQFNDAKLRLLMKYPNKKIWLDKQLKKASDGAVLRERGRSEFVRIFRLNRAFALKVSELMQLNNDVFFLYIREVEALLLGDLSALKHVPVRKENYNKYKKIPVLPSFIRGRFDPLEWSKDPNKRLDFYDASRPITNVDNNLTLTGFAGSAGSVEGIVRILVNPENGHRLKKGEILVAMTTNIGWTPLFIKAAAIITDIGAPLSHATIVARELGIPAVVGCGNATTKLKSGDRVMVDGSHGIVHILKY